MSVASEAGAASRRRFLRLLAGAAAVVGGGGLAGPASAALRAAAQDAAPGSSSLDEHIRAVTFWKQRFDTNGDGLFDERDVTELLGRKGAAPSDARFHFAFDFDGDDAVTNRDVQRLFDLLDRFPDGYLLDPAADVPTLPTIASYYPWYTPPRRWRGARSIPLRGPYDSNDRAVYLEQRLEAHAAGIDVFAVSAFTAAQAERFHAMQAPLAQAREPALTRFLWLYEIFARLPFTLNRFGAQTFDFDARRTRATFVAQMVHLAGFFDDNYLTIDGRFHPVWIWVSHTIRGDFAGAVQEARAAVRSCCGKELAIVGGEAAQFPPRPGADAEIERRLRAFLAVSHYGIYTPRFTLANGGRLNRAHTDFTIDNLLVWVEALRRQGSDNIHGRPLTYWPPSQFAFDDTAGPRGNPPLRANRAEIEYYLQQLDRRVVQPNLDLVTHLNHTSYNEHREGHGLEPTAGYNAGRSWLRLYNVYRGPSRYYRQAIVRNPELQARLAAAFAR